MRDLHQVIVLCTWERRLFYSRNASREYMIMVPANCRERGEVAGRGLVPIPSQESSKMSNRFMLRKPG